MGNLRQPIAARSQLLGLLAGLGLLGSAQAAIVLEHNFASDSTGAAVADGATVGTGKFNSAQLKDDSGNNYQGQTLADAGDLATYATASIPSVPAPLPPGWDGRAIRFTGSKDKN